MQIKKHIPLVSTSKLSALKEFYVKHFGFKPTHDSPEYLGLSSGDVEIAFMPPDTGKELFQGGLLFCLEVANVDAEYDRLTRAGLKPTRPLQDNPWGDRSFAVEDPAGVTVYIHHPIPPSGKYKS